MPARQTTLRRKLIPLGVGLLVTGACLWFVFQMMTRDEPPEVVWRKIVTAFRTANYWTLPAIWLCLFLFYWIKSWRWRLLLSPLGDFQPLRDLFPPIMIGFAANNVLPARVGEFVRVFFFARKARLNAVAVLSSVVLERILDAITILLLLGLGLIFVQGIDDDVRRVFYIVAVGALVALAGAVVFLIWTRPFVQAVDICLRAVRIVPAGLRQKVEALLGSAASGMRALRNGRLLTGITIMSLLHWIINAAVVHLSLWSFGIQVSPLVSCVVLGVVAFGVAVPSVPGYFGVIQLCFVQVLAVFKNADGSPLYDEATVFSASVYFQMSQFVVVTLIGAYYFLRSGLSVSQVEEEVEQEQEDAHLA